MPVVGLGGVLIEDIAPAAVGAFDVAHLRLDMQENPGMAQGTAAAVASDSGGVHFDGLESFSHEPKVPICPRRIQRPEARVYAAVGCKFQGLAARG